jgi:ribonuclease HI
MKNHPIVIHTDGACSGNGMENARGGYGAILRNPQGKTLEIAGPLEGHPQTNQRAELTAAIKALEALRRPCVVELYTDSQYLQKGATEWLRDWKARDWKTSSRSPVKNADLWENLDKLMTIHHVSIHWVKGHSGSPDNDRADYLADMGASGKTITRRTEAS